MMNERFEQWKSQQDEKRAARWDRCYNPDAPVSEPARYPRETYPRPAVIHNYPLKEGQQHWRQIVQSLVQPIIHQSEGYDAWEAKMLETHDLVPRASFNPANGECLGIRYEMVPKT